MLELKNVSKFYYNKGIIASGFSKVNLKLNMGEFVVITGESGSGKSTLLNVISGLDSYEEGEMYIDGQETSHYTEKDFENFRRKYISNIFQTFNLVNSYTVYQNIELVLLLNGYKKREIKKKVLDLIKKVDLYKFKNTKVSKLSGGQKQRVAIARALAKETPIIIADEPTGNLDTESASSVIKLLSEVAKDKLVIIVTHNYEQLEEFATRKIKMHDGRILEDKIIKKADKLENNYKEVKIKNISLLNQIRLGVRNTFNILGKFILLFAVFLFITVAIISEYSSFRKQEHLLATSGYNYVFQDTSLNRIVLKKKDNSSFTKDDYLKLETIENVDYLVKNDLLLDTGLELTNNSNMYLNCSLSNIQFFKETLDVGRMPENDEIIIEGSKNYYYLSEMLEELMNSELYIIFNGEIDTSKKVKVVGIKYCESDYMMNNKAYVSDSLLNSLKFKINEQYSKTQMLFLGKYSNAYLSPNERVPQGKAYVSYDLINYNNGYSIINKPLQIDVENIYYKDTLNLTVERTYTKNNIKSLLGLSNYEEQNGKIFINPEDYNSLYNKASYQSSIFVKDEEKINETKEKLNNMGYEAIVIKDTLVEEGATQMIQIMRTVITIILIITLFFISYFIIKIILKSRNIYFSTIRMLGANQKIAKRLLIIELLTVANVAYILFVGAILLNSKGIISITWLKNMVDIRYLKFLEFAILYLIIIGISYLISLKYAKNLFKKSTIKTYNEEV